MHRTKIVLKSHHVHVPCHGQCLKYQESLLSTELYIYPNHLHSYTTKKQFYKPHSTSITLHPKPSIRRLSLITYTTYYTYSTLPWQPLLNSIFLGSKVVAMVMYCIQSNLSIPDTLGCSKTVLIIEVSLFQRFIYTHLYCSGTTVNCPYYRGVLISECPQ